MTKVLAVAGSARRGGNSDTILEAALDAMRRRGADVETVVPYDVHIEPCRSCGGCWRTGRCVIEDEMQALYARFLAVDHIVVAAPVYFASLPGHLKVMIDRFQPFWVRTFRLKDPPQPRRVGMFLCISAMVQESFYTNSRGTIGAWMACLNMKCAVGCHFSGLDAKNAVSEHPEHLAEAARAAEELLGRAP